MRFKKLIDCEIDVIGKLSEKYLYYPCCFTPKTIVMKLKLTLFSLLGIKGRKAVFFCTKCNKEVKALEKGELRDFKLKYIIDGDTKNN